MRPANVENETSQVTNVGERDYTDSSVRQLSQEDEKRKSKEEKEHHGNGGAADCSHASYLPRSHFHYSKLVHCAAWTLSAHGTRLLAKGVAASWRWH